MNLLSREDVKRMADLFFNGKPKEAFKVPSNMDEWDQFTGSLSEKYAAESYRIGKSCDMTEFDKIPWGEGKVYHTYDIGY